MPVVGQIAAHRLRFEPGRFKRQGCYLLSIQKS